MYKQMGSLGASFVMIVMLAALMPVAGALAAGDANMASCSNEAMTRFTPSLPDCRAYELVSPPYKEGFAAREGVAVSNDGARALVQSLGAFAGAENISLFGQGMYEFERGTTGWQPIAAFNPPAESYPLSEFVDASAGLQRTLWLAIPAAQFTGLKEGELANELLLREAQPGGGVDTVDVGPLAKTVETPNAAGSTTPLAARELGASSDLTHLVFGVRVYGSPLHKRLAWPGDESVSGISLYEYVGAGHSEPTLVGVSNGGGTLISQCGTALGGYVSALDIGAGEVHLSSTFNAVSANGEEVFFTAEAGGCSGENEAHETVTGAGPPARELFARVDGSDTVAISEPSKEDCEACDTEPGAVNDAVFQGASEDGSKVFFTTEQELLPGHTGVNLYEYDFNAEKGHRIVLISAGSTAPEVQGVARISRDGSHIYFVAKSVLTSSQNVEARVAETGEDNLYVFDTLSGAISFVATLAPADVADWQNEDERPVQDNGCQPAEPGCEAGRFLVFVSKADLTGSEDTSTTAQLFEYDAQTGDIVRVSVGQAGYNDDGNTTAAANAPTLPSPKYAGGAVEAGSGDPSSDLATEGSLAVSDNGAYVFFQSADALTPQAANSVLLGEEDSGAPVYAQNVYEYHAGGVDLLSDGHDLTANLEESNVHLLGADASGGNAFFTTADRLSPQDLDTQVDLYDARIDGGFPAPAPAGCEGDGCQGALSGTPSSPALGGSAIQTGGGNLPPAAAKPVVTPKTKPLTRAQKLAKALKACHPKQNKKKRASCEAAARKRYATKIKVTKSAHHKAKGQR
jgi:hypothetical protein